MLCRRITAFNRKNPWPEPHRSIGESWCSMGKNRCWEAIGPAKETYDEVSERIKALLESQHEFLNEGVCVFRFLMFDLYMIGRTEEQAKPTIIFTSENKTLRQRAQKLVRGSSILDKYPGFTLGDSSIPPRLSSGPIALSGEQSTADFAESYNASSSTDNMACVYYSHPLSGIYGIPIIIKKANTSTSPSPRKATLGGMVCIGEKLFGVTAAHAFFDDTEKAQSTGKDTMEFSLEDEDEDADEYEEVDDSVDVTSRGSVSPLQWPSDERESLDSVGSDLSQYKFPACPTNEPEIAISLSPIPDENRIQETSERHLELIGRMSATSQSTSSNNLDWALIQIDRQEHIYSVGQTLKVPYVKSVIRAPWERKSVQIVTSSNGITNGIITGSQTYMRLPHSMAFQEMWAVQLNGPLKHGDCGSWVVNPDCGGLYGYITTGNPGTSIAYLVPAYQAFSDMEKRLGSKVTFPSFGEQPMQDIAQLAIHRSPVSLTQVLTPDEGSQPLKCGTGGDQHGSDVNRPSTCGDEIRVMKLQSLRVSAPSNISCPSTWTGDTIENKSRPCHVSSTFDTDRTNNDSKEKGPLNELSAPGSPENSFKLSSWTRMSPFRLLSLGWKRWIYILFPITASLLIGVIIVLIVLYTKSKKNSAVATILTEAVFPQANILPIPESGLGAATIVLGTSFSATTPSGLQTNVVYNGGDGKICIRQKWGSSWLNSVQCVEGANPKPNTPITALDWLGGPSIYFITADNFISGIDHVPQNDTWKLSSLASQKTPTHNLSQLASVTWLNGTSSWLYYQDANSQLREFGIDDYRDVSWRDGSIGPLGLAREGSGIGTARWILAGNEVLEVFVQTEYDDILERVYMDDAWGSGFYAVDGTADGISQGSAMTSTVVNQSNSTLVLLTYFSSDGNLTVQSRGTANGTRTQFNAFSVPKTILVGDGHIPTGIAAFGSSGGVTEIYFVSDQSILEVSGNDVAATNWTTFNLTSG